MIKKIRNCAIAFLFGVVSSFTPEMARASSDPIWNVVPVEPQKVFVEPLFQDGEVVHVDLQEWLPTTCYRRAPVVTDVDLIHHQVTLTDQAFVEEGVLCAMSISPPIKRTVEIGVLPAGSYELLISGSHGEPKQSVHFRISDPVYRD